MPSSQPNVTDSCTTSVREFYELYPYPSYSSPTLRAGFDARFVLSQGQRARPGGAPLQLLDAGCGRGVGLVAYGALHPGAQVLGIDLCQRALADARGEIARRGLTNTRLQEVDLMTLEGLEVPPGGFDVIYSSGVVHHLPQPAAGLEKLSRVLAPSGVMVFMVYGSIGRRGIKRVTRALKAWLEPDLALANKLEQARFLVDALAQSENPECPWLAASRAPDAEFVDRYLHPLETDYDVNGFFELIEGAGLRFLDWCVPEQWSLDGTLEPGALRNSIEALPEHERFAMIEQIVQPLNLQAYLVKPENSPRRLPQLDQWRPLVFAVHPEVQFEVGSRNLWREHRIESVAYRLRTSERVELESATLRRACLMLATQAEPFHGETLIEALVEEGESPQSALECLGELVRRRLIYAPHPE